MSDFEYFSVIGDRAEFRPRGEVSLAQGTGLIKKAIARTRELGLRNLLVNATQLTGFASPSLASRFHFVHEWADAAKGAVRVACVSRPELIDPRKFGVLVASNIGLQGDVFLTEEEAIQWLDGPSDGGPDEVTPEAADLWSRAGK